MFLSLKSFIVLFPIVAGVFLTGLGIVNMREANLVLVEEWNSPYGLLVFSSEPLSRTILHLDIHLTLSDLESRKIPTSVELFFELAEPEVFKEYPDREVLVGVQFPFKITNYKNLEIELRDIRTLSPLEKEVITKEEHGATTSLFYTLFTPPQEAFTREWHGYTLRISFDWEESIRRESYSVFALTLPITLGLDPEQMEYPYEQSSKASFAYYADCLGLSVGLESTWDFEIKRSFPVSDVMMTETGGDSFNIYWEPKISGEGKPISAKSLQMFMVEFEVNKYSEKRDRLLFDSGLYMGLGIGLVFSGISEALKGVGYLKSRIRT